MAQVRGCFQNKKQLYIVYNDEPAAEKEKQQCSRSLFAAVF